MIASYTDVSYDLAEILTQRYSSSFGLATRFFSRDVRKHIYAIYGMVRVADEIVDTYKGADKSELLDSFQQAVHAGLVHGYSTNPIIQAFSAAAREFEIGVELIDPFFTSMRMDVSKTQFTQKEYDDYIYGSAEVIGLMCLRVFTHHDHAKYDALSAGARKLGSAYQKVNFLRDFASDYYDRGRIYFPDATITKWGDDKKLAITQELNREFDEARDAIVLLPQTARTAVYLSFLYYRALLRRLEAMSASQVLTERAHVSTLLKLSLIVAAPLRGRLR